MNSQKFYFLKTRKFSYLRLSRGTNFSSFKITKLHVLLYEISCTKVYLWLTFTRSVCLQELWWSRFRRVAVFSWCRVGSSDPTVHQLTRWKGTKRRVFVWRDMRSDQNTMRDSGNVLRDSRLRNSGNVLRDTGFHCYPGRRIRQTWAHDAWLGKKTFSGKQWRKFPSGGGGGPLGYLG